MEILEIIRQMAMRHELSKVKQGLEALSKGPSISKDDLLLTSKQVAPMIGVRHHKTVEIRAREGKLPCVRVGRTVRFRYGDVCRWAAQRKEG